MAAELPPEAAAAGLQRSLARLDDRVRRWPATRWEASRADGRPTRAEAAYELACTLARLARQAGNGAPDIAPARVVAHAIADQLTVLGRELLNAPDAAAAAGEALDAIDRLEELL
jgi:hypothetical protein